MFNSKIKMLINLANKIIINILKKCLQIIRKGGIHTWPSFSYEIWVLIQFTLMNERPDKLVEFGSGRSTHYLAEYSQKCNKLLYSIEQNFMYLLRNWIGLRCSFIKNFHLVFVPIKGDWFDIKKLKKIKGLKNADFLLIDGPGGALNKGLRNSQSGLNFLKEYYPYSTTIIIDDLQREAIKNFTKDFISHRTELYFLLLKYRVNTYNPMKNLILFCVKKENKDKYLQFMGFTKIDKSLVFHSENCDDLFKFLKQR